MKKQTNKIMRAAVLVILVLAMLVQPIYAVPFYAPKPEIDASYEHPVKILSTDQQEKEFILNTETESGKRNILSFSFPKDGGLRLHSDWVGFFEPEELSTITYRTEGDATVLTDGKQTLYLYLKASPWRFELANANGTRVIAYGANSIGFGYDSDGVLQKVKTAHSVFEDEVFFGLGERFNGFVQNGQTIEMWNLDAGVDIARPTGNLNVSYINVPLLHSNGGYTEFYNNAYYGKADIADSRTDQVSFEFSGPILDLFIWTDSSAENIAHYNVLTGSTVTVPKWSLSYWIGQDKKIWESEGSDNASLNAMLKEKLDRYEALETPIHTILAEGICAMYSASAVMNYMKSRNVHFIGWMDSRWNTYDTTYSAADVANAISIKPDRYPLIQSDSDAESNYQDRNGMCWVDYTNPSSVEWLKQRFRAFVNMGLSGMKVDYNDTVTLEMYYPGSGDTGDWMHNFSCYYYDKAMYEAFHSLRKDDYINIARAGCAGSQAYTAVFAGDQTSSWHGLSIVVSALLSSSASGINIWGSDIGGLGAQSDVDKQNPELYARWLEFGTFSPLMFSQGQTGWRDPWAYDDGSGSTIETFQKYYWTRESIVDLIYSSTIKASLENIPITKAMAIAYPGQKDLARNESQYLFCDSLLVCPVTEKDARETQVQFPEGKWISLWDGSVIEGGSKQTVSAALDTIPVYIREGAAFPLTLGDALDVGKMNTGNVTAKVLAVTPTVGKVENKLYEDENTPYTVICDSVKEDVYRVQTQQENSRGMVTVMGYQAEYVRLDGKALTALAEKPTAQATEAGYFYDSENNSTIVVTGGKWGVLEYSASEALPDSIPEPEPSDFNYTLLIVCIAVAAVLLIGAAVVVAMMRRKKRSTEK